MECTDNHCAVHAKILPRGKTFIGKVVEAKAQKTATIEWERKKYIPKYERYERGRTRVKAHNPDCMQIRQGDNVEIRECRPISKTKKFVILKKIETEVKKSK